MDAAFDNLNRIRLIWGRLWAALAAHLVAAACHADPRVSVLAVGHMRALVQRLLSRSELSCFTHQVIHATFLQLVSVSPLYSNKLVQNKVSG